MPSPVESIRCSLTWIEDSMASLEYYSNWSFLRENLQKNMNAQLKHALVAAGELQMHLAQAATEILLDAANRDRSQKEEQRNEEARYSLEKQRAERLRLEQEREQKRWRPAPGTKSESPIEDMFLFSARALGLELEQQMQIGKYRVDFAIPSLKIAIETDGHEHHSSRKQRSRDARQMRELLALGWHCVRYTGTEITESSDACVRDLITIKEARGLALAETVASNGEPSDG